MGLFTESVTDKVGRKGREAVLWVPGVALFAFALHAQPHELIQKEPERAMKSSRIWGK